MKTLTLTRQLIAIIVFLLFITSLVTSLPALLLHYTELERQIDLRLTTGEKLTQTIWSLTEFQIQQSVTLASQRPTLQQLVLENRDRTAIDSYLETFRSSTPLDFLVVQTGDGQMIGETPLTTSIEIGEISAHDTFPSYAVQASVVDDVIVLGGIWLDDEFLQLLSQQTDLEYQVDGQPIDENFYRTRQINLSDSYVLVMLLDITDIRLTQITAFISVISIALLAAGIGSLVGGLYLRQRIRPLWRLRKFAKNLGEGDLQTPIIVDTYSPEIRTFADTLEHSRQRISTVMQQLQHERDWSNALMQSIIEGIITVDQTAVITFHSESTRQIMSWEQNRIGEKLDSVFVLSETNQNLSAQLPPEGGQKLINVLSNKQSITLLITRARSLPDGETTLVIRDVTEENRKSNAQAYYLANMSHEFRTPLSGMKASIELLTENNHSLARVERQQLLNSLLMSIANLQRLIDNLLEGSKLQTQKFSLHTQSLRFEQILVDALHTMQPLLNRRQQVLTLTLPIDSIAVTADHTRLVQVMVNLLSNASKYSPENTEISINVRYTDTTLWVGVADHGLGVPEHQREAIFQQFVRLEQSAISDHGTGLGLSVVRGIIEAHGGKVGIDSHAQGGEGSVFWFLIPIIKASAV